MTFSSTITLSLIQIIFVYSFEYVLSANLSQEWEEQKVKIKCRDPQKKGQKDGMIKEWEKNTI
jgi:hypothetical protein